MNRPVPDTTGGMPRDPFTPPPADTFELMPDERVDRLKEHVSTLLSTLAILAVAVGLGWALWPYIGPWALCAGGALLGLLVAVADGARAPKPIPATPEPPAPARKPVPGPSDAGRLHAKGPGATP